MKIILIMVSILSLVSQSSAAETAFVDYPKNGETRPNWWLSCWLEHIIVVEGTIDDVLDLEPDISIEFNKQTISQFLSEEEVELARFGSKFKIVNLSVENLLFASPGINKSNFNVAEALQKKGTIKVLISVFQLEGGAKMSAFTYKAGVKGTFIINYTDTVSPLSLVYNDHIPNEKIDDAKSILRYRTHFDYTKKKNWLKYNLKNKKIN